MQVVRVRAARTSGDAAEVDPTLQGSVARSEHSLYTDSRADLTVVMDLQDEQGACYEYEEVLTAKYFSKGQSRDVWKGHSQYIGDVVIKLEAPPEQGLPGTSAREVDLRNCNAGVREMTGEIFFSGQVEVMVGEWGHQQRMTASTKKNRRAETHFDLSIMEWTLPLVQYLAGIPSMDPSMNRVQATARVLDLVLGLHSQATRAKCRIADGHVANFGVRLDERGWVSSMVVLDVDAIESGLRVQGLARKVRAHLLHIEEMCREVLEDRDRCARAHLVVFGVPTWGGDVDHCLELWGHEAVNKWSNVEIQGGQQVVQRGGQQAVNKWSNEAVNKWSEAVNKWSTEVTPCRDHTYGVDAQESCMGCRNWCDEMDRRTAAAVALPPPPLPTGVWRPTPPLGREQPADASRSTAAMRWRRPQRLYSRRGAQPR